MPLEARGNGQGNNGNGNGNSHANNGNHGNGNGNGNSGNGNGGKQTCVVPFANGADDTPAIEAAAAKCKSNAIIEFSQGVD